MSLDCFHMRSLLFARTQITSSKQHLNRTRGDRKKKRGARSGQRRNATKKGQKANSHLLSGIHIEHITNINMALLNGTNKSYSNDSNWKMDFRLPCKCHFWTICNRIGFQWCWNQMHDSFQSNLSCVWAGVRYDLYAVHIHFMWCYLIMLLCSFISFEFHVNVCLVHHNDDNKFVFAFSNRIDIRFFIVSTALPLNIVK